MNGCARAAAWPAGSCGAARRSSLIAARTVQFGGLFACAQAGWLCSREHSLTPGTQHLLQQRTAVRWS